MSRTISSGGGGTTAASLFQRTDSAGPTQGPVWWVSRTSYTPSQCPRRARSRPILQTEIPSADRIDLLCAFIKWNGFRVLEGALRAHLDRGRALRVTTPYIGATERRAPSRALEP